MNTIEQIAADIQAHLQSASVVQLGEGREFRQPVPAIRCGDGTELSIQAGEMVYSLPRNNTGPWTHVEVMTLNLETVPVHFRTDQCDIGAYVPILAVAQEIFDRRATKAPLLSS
jgi:hypothetical protein